MADQFVGEIRIFGCNFAPFGWAECNGQLLPIGQNTALFSLLGIQFGGDGKSTFALPNLQGCAPMNMGQGAGLTQRDIGESGGEDSVTLLPTEIPSHSHTLQASETALTATTEQLTPTNNLLAESYANPRYAKLYATGTPAAALNADAVSIAGGGLPHNNLQPYLVVNFCIALQGISSA